MKILFTDVLGVSDIYYPTPAKASMPEWYKSMDSYLFSNKTPLPGAKTSGTIKRCMPVFDAITSGYILYTYVDVWVSQRLEGDGTKAPYYEWPTFQPIDFHIMSQVPTDYPKAQDTPYAKWMNPWGVKTPNGYSCLFTQPVHRNSIFTILDGVVDTDRYTLPVNFPFVLNDPSFEGLIPAGTPMAQVIPFKRESWNMSIGSSKDAEDIGKTATTLKSFIFDGYKSLFRQAKEYN